MHIEFPDVGKVLRRLAVSYTLAILSNVETKVLQATVKHIGAPFVALVTAEDLQSYKPAPKHWEVALKRLLPQLANDKLFVEDFIREAKLAAQLDHPNIVPIYELGVDSQKRPFFSMKKVGLLVLVLATPSFGQVTYERLFRADQEPENWLTYSGNFSSHRFSALDGIDRSNVEALRPVWIYQMQGSGAHETSPLVVDGIMYVTEPPATVAALDVKTGRTRLLTTDRLTCPRWSPDGKTIAADDRERSELVILDISALHLENGLPAARAPAPNPADQP